MAAHIGNVSTEADVALFYHAILQMKTEHQIKQSPQSPN
jgi:hypothetical protein